ncbi:RHS repeat domain-containing protein [Streptomyces cyaneofuscatus]|uniref:RHS repeat domain-containing protein n=1 Tax=Streptomyces cyaneofuscatus TaxID=66883 RepID=UPI0038139279
MFIVQNRRVVSVAVSIAMGVSLPWLTGVGDAFAAAPQGPGDGLSAALSSLGGAVDERTGEVRFGPLLGGVSGAAGSGLQVRAHYSQKLATAEVDRFGLGTGVSLGLTFIDVERGSVVLPSGEQMIDDSTDSGFRDYRLQDVRFRKGRGSAPVPFAYVLESLKDGSRQFFDDAGDLAAVEDRFGHVTRLAWGMVNGTHRLESVTGGWGSRLSVSYSGSKVTFTSPKRWGQSTAPETVVELKHGRMASVTDPVGERTSVEWAAQDGGVVVPVSVVSPAGARTEFRYHQYEPRSGGVLAVSEFVVKDAQGDVILDPVKVSLDPDGENEGRNFTGCPQHCGEGAVRLEDSGDASFSYRVRFSQANGQEVERSYNALHLKKSEVMRVQEGSKPVEVSRTEYAYPGENDGAPPKVQDAPPNYQMPSQVRVVTVDPANIGRSKESVVSSEFDSMGRQVKQVQGGIERTTEYGENSIPARTLTKDSESGAYQVVENGLTEDGRAIARTVSKAAKDGTSKPAVVSSEEFEYETGELSGELKRSSLTGDPSAEGGDPGDAQTSTSSAIDKDNEGVGRRTTAVVGADGVKAVTVTDLASGLTLSQKVGDLAETSTGYDIGDRPVEVTDQDGRVTHISYGTGDEVGAVTRRRKSDGFASRSLTDALGREVRTESNYRPSGNEGQGQILPQGEWRQTAAAEFDTTGQQIGATDAAGRKTQVTHDAWGLPETVTTADGTVTRVSRDAVAGTKTTHTLAAEENKPAVMTTETFDESGNTVRAENSYGDGTSGVTQGVQFDAFGRPVHSETDSEKFAVDHTYTSSGLLENEKLSSKQGESGQEPRATHAYDALGGETTKTLMREGRSITGFTTAYDAAGRSHAISAPGDAGETTTDFNKVNGLVDSVTMPDGAVNHRRHDSSGRTVESWTSPSKEPMAKQQHIRTSYDPVSGKISAHWFEGAENDSKITYAYYPDGSLQKRTDPGGKTTSFTYTDDGKSSKITDHTGAVSTFEYEPDSGNLMEVVQTRDDIELGRVSYGYDSANRLERITRGNGTVSTYTHNDAGLPTGEKHTGSDGEVLAENSYDYNDQLQLRTDRAVADGKSTVTSCTYDDLGRLTAKHTTDGDQPGEGAPVQTSEYGYDLAANLTRTKETTRIDGQERTINTEFRHDTGSRVTAVTVDGVEEQQSYDDANRLSRAADGTVHTYNASGQVTGIEVPGGATIANTYNAAGERSTQTTRSADGQENTLTYLPGTESDQNGTTATYLTGITRESRTLTAADNQKPQTSYYLTNRHGSIVRTLEEDGRAGSTYSYTAYGQDSPTPDGQTPSARNGAITENPYGYAGEYTTPTGHQTLGARWYNPKTAAFTTPDTPTAGMLNPYTYATGDPINHTDPTGQSPEDAWNWFNNNILSWEGLPYLDIGIGVGAAALTLASGGIGVPLAVALVGLAATVPAAADQIAINTTGKGFMPDTVRTGFDVASLAAGVTDLGIGSASAPRAVRKVLEWWDQRAAAAKIRSLALSRIAQSSEGLKYHTATVPLKNPETNLRKVTLEDQRRAVDSVDSLFPSVRADVDLNLEGTVGLPVMNKNSDEVRWIRRPKEGQHDGFANLLQSIPETQRGLFQLPPRNRIPDPRVDDCPTWMKFCSSVRPR